jgi:hypothetical protein
MCFKLLLLLALVLSLVACQQQSSSQNNTVNTQELTQQLLTICKQETKDFYKKDLKAWSQHFSQSNTLSWLCVEEDVTLRANGWNDLNQFVTNYMKENPTPDSDSLLNLNTYQNVTLEQANDLVFLNYQLNQMTAKGTYKLIRETRTFKKENNQWKILSLTSAPGYNTANSSNNVFVHTPSK